jgi:hypothetical protein
MLQGIEDICGAKHGTVTWLVDVYNLYGYYYCFADNHKQIESAFSASGIAQELCTR